MSSPVRILPSESLLTSLRVRHVQVTGMQAYARRSQSVFDTVARFSETNIDNLMCQPEHPAGINHTFRYRVHMQLTYADRGNTIPPQGNQFSLHMGRTGALYTLHKGLKVAARSRSQKVSNSSHRLHHQGWIWIQKAKFISVVMQMRSWPVGHGQSFLPVAVTDPSGRPLLAY
jgi:hypothetical protein